MNFSTVEVPGRLSKMTDFRGKNVLVTGASSGIGAALSRRFALQGANVFLAARNLERLEEVRLFCESQGVTARSFVVDFSNEESITDFASEVLSEGLLFDCIVLNAGISQRAKAFDTDFSVDRQIMETNFFGPVLLTKKLEPMLRGERKVHMAVTTSISGLFGFPLRTAYCASKHALFGWFEALEIENQNITMTFLIPGRINTPISKSAIHGDGSVHGTMDAGQANGMDVDKCAEVAFRAIARGRHRKLIGGFELVMVYIRKYIPALFFKIAPRISAT